jgi:hypothetical protein
MGSLYILVVLAILLTLAVLMLGLGAFTTGGEFNKKYANKIMRWRIILQAIAVALIVLYVALRGG